MTWSVTDEVLMIRVALLLMLDNKHERFYLHIQIQVEYHHQLFRCRVTWNPQKVHSSHFHQENNFLV